VIVGVRFGLREHLEENKKIFKKSFELDADDYASIAEVQKSASRSLMKVFGDCGGEYRRRA